MTDHYFIDTDDGDYIEREVYESDVLELENRCDALREKLDALDEVVAMKEQIQANFLKRLIAMDEKLYREKFKSEETEKLLLKYGVK